MSDDILFSTSMGKKPVQIVRGDIETLLQLSPQVPEFQPPYLTLADYYGKTAGKQTLILLAKVDQEIAGFKAGYANSDTFYSWLGAVFPKFRRLGLAKMLARVQEAEVKTMGFQSVTFKTRNCHRNMLLFGIKNGFQIIGFDPREDTSQNRIILRKEL